MMHNDLVYFLNITNSRWFRKSEFVLAFTKLDLFTEKIRTGKRPFSEYFPAYDGDPYDIRSVLEFIASMFQKSVGEGRGGWRLLPVYFLDATQTCQIRGLLSLLEWVIANLGDANERT